jgi:hypothetical protein
MQETQHGLPVAWTGKNSGKLEHGFYITLWKSIPNEEASGQCYFRGRRGVSGFLEQMNEK